MFLSWIYSGLISFLFWENSPSANGGHCSRVCARETLPPLGPSSTLAEIFRHMCLQSHLQTSPISYPKFRNPRTTFETNHFSFFLSSSIKTSVLAYLNWSERSARASATSGRYTRHYFSFFLCSSGLFVLSRLGPWLADDFKGKTPHWLLEVTSYWSELSASSSLMSYEDGKQTYWQLFS